MLGLAIERVSALLQMHQVRGAADLHIAFHDRIRQGIKQPSRIRVRANDVPLTADDCDGRADTGGIVCKFALPRGGDVIDDSGWRFDARRRASAAILVCLEIALAPIVEVFLR